MKIIKRNEAITLICKKEMKSLNKEDREGHILNMWSIDEKDIEFNSLSKVLKKEIMFNEYPARNLKNPHYDKLIFLSLSSKFKGVTNFFISIKLFKIGFGKYYVYGEIEKLEICPCCNYNTLDARGEYDICPLCYWEDTGVNELDIYVSINQQSLGEAKTKFDKIKNSLFEIKNQKYLKKCDVHVISNRPNIIPPKKMSDF